MMMMKIMIVMNDEDGLQLNIKIWGFLPFPIFSLLSFLVLFLPVALNSLAFPSLKVGLLNPFMGSRECCKPFIC